MKIFSYDLVRSKRCTICISVEDGKVTVKAPLYTSVEEIEKFVKSKSSWIENQLHKSSKFDFLKDYSNILVKGEIKPLIFGDCNKIENDCVIIESLKNIKELYIKTFSDEFIALFNSINLSFDFNVNDLQFKSFKARWGCCDNKGNITFNYKLLMLPKDLWECVIVHELCHTVYMNHSKQFHALNKMVMPDYSSVHKKLKDYSSVCRLY